jgi:small subunit ribosomal protein S1
VSSLASYGAFIDLGGADGLLHVSEIRWERTNRPEDALAVGEEFEVEVIELDESRDRISLSRRSLVENPWEVFARNHPEGSRAQGVVSSLTDFGAFVSIDGVDGLIHISELSWDRGVREAAEVLSVGQEVEALVLRIEPERQRVGLSLKRLGANPWEVALSDLNVGEHRKGRVRNVASFGVFVEILPGVEGLVHVSDMSWTKRVDKPSDFHKFEADEEIEVAVLEIDAERQRLKLGIKQLDSDPWELAGPELRDGGTLTVTISRLAPFGAFATIAEGLEGLIHISEISTERVERVEDAVKVGQERKVRVLSADRDKRKISLSIKAYSDEDADALREYAEAAPAGSSALAEQLIAKGLVSPAPEPAEAAPVEAEAAPVEAEAAPAEAEAAPAEAAPAEAEAAPAEAEAAPEGVDPEVAQQS